MELAASHPISIASKYTTGKNNILCMQIPFPNDNHEAQINPALFSSWKISLEWYFAGVAQKNYGNLSWLSHISDRHFVTENVSLALCKSTHL